MARILSMTIRRSGTTCGQYLSRMAGGRFAVKRDQERKHYRRRRDRSRPGSFGLSDAGLQRGGSREAISQLCPKTSILMVTLHLSKQLIEAAQLAGVRGACAKQDIGSVVEAVEILLREETYFPTIGLD